jgi:hypothetical protein
MKERKNTAISFIGGTRTEESKHFHILRSKSKQLKKKNNRVAFIKKFRGCQTGNKKNQGKL